MGTLPFSHPFPSTFKPQLAKPARPTSPLLSLPLPPQRLRAQSDSNSDATATEPAATPSPPSSATAAAAEDPSFDSRLAQVRLKYRSGTGKKAEQRRAKKGKGKGGSGPGGVMLPPVSLREPTTAGGVKVEVGFTPYSERLNGAVAALGLAALVLVELGSGKGLFSFHAPPIVFVQVYTVAALAAVYVKWERERISVWPEKPAAASDASPAGEE